MSLYEALRFKGIVKKEFRDIFEPIALEGKWLESSDPVFADFGELCEYPGPFPPCCRVIMVDRWKNDPWKCSYNAETGEWAFDCEYNQRNWWELAYSFKNEIIPYCMESVEHYETWCEPDDFTLNPQSTFLERYHDGQWEDVGIFTGKGEFKEIQKE